MHSIIRKVREYIEDNSLLSKGMTVIVGVSGGADSVCLLKVLNELKAEYALSLYAVHVEHGIRGEEAIEDMEFVKSLCQEICVPLNVYSINVPEYAKKHSMTLEEAGRYVRYDAFKEEYDKYEADVIAVAHHLNDQAETALFNIIRGSGLRGVSGIAPKRDSIIRPLLTTSRTEIEGYLEDAGQAYRIDSTNSDLDYSRNVIRNVVIPKLEEVVNGATSHIARACDEIREADAYIQKEADRAEEAVVKAVDNNVYSISVHEITKYEPIIRRYVIRNVLKNVYNTHKDLENIHVEDILSLTYKQSGRSISLPGEKKALRLQDDIIIGRTCDVMNSKSDKVEMMLTINEEIELPYGWVLKAGIIDNTADFVIEDELYTKYLDYDKISNGLMIRGRQQGDYLMVDEAGSCKKIKKYLIDEKVPVNKRDGMIFIADGNHICWVIGMRISAYYKVSSSTKKILKLEYYKTES